MAGVWSPGAGASEGNDVYVGDDTDEIVYGLGGDDALSGGNGNDTLYGGDGDDILRPGSSQQTDIAYGGAGDDYIANASQAYGGTGNDTYDLSNNRFSPVEYADEGVDSIFTISTSFSLVGYSNIENLFLAWTFTQSYFSTYLPAQGINFFASWPGSFYGTSSSLTATGNALNNILVTDAGADSLYGLDGDDQLFGEFGSDRLEGGNGNDALHGGASNDTLIGGAGDDILYGDHGLDTASYADASSAVAVDLRIAGPQNMGALGSDTLVQIENVVGSAYNDVLIGTDGGQVTRISSDRATGLQGHGKNPSMQANGATMAFESLGSLVPADVDSWSDIYLKNLLNGEITRVSTSSAGAAANGNSDQAFLSFYGTKVAFRSDASNLVAGDTNGVSDIFVKDLRTGVTARVSTDADGGEGAFGSYGAQLSGDAETVVFYTRSRLVADDANDVDDVYSKNLTTGALTLISGGDAAGGASRSPFFAAWANKVAFVSQTENGGSGIFVKDLASGSLTLASITAEGVQANADSSGISMAGGNLVAFESAADNLVAGDTNGQSDIFLKDLTTGAITRVSTSAAGVQANGASSGAVLYGSSQIVFSSSASNLVVGDTNGVSDVFLKDLTTGVVTRVSTGAGDLQSGGASYNAAFVGGTTIIFESLSDTLTSGDGNGMPDVFIKDLGDTGANVLTGGAGSDTLSGGKGADTLDGGSGDDLLTGGDGDDILAGGDNNDLLNGGLGNDTLAGDNNNDLLIGGLGDDTLSGGAGDDVLLTGDGAGTIVDGAPRLTSYSETGGGNDTLDGGAGLDLAYMLYGDRTGNIVFDNRNATTYNGVSIDNWFGGSVIRVEQILFLAGSGADTITGGGGDDLIRGGAGVDVLDGWTGVDTLDYSDKTLGVSVTLSTTSDSIATVGGVAEDTIRNFENVYGGAGNDVLGGSGLNNRLLGGAGDDLLQGGGGVDTLDGGDGVDLADYSDKTATVGVMLNGATGVTVYVGGAAEDGVRNVENVTGGSGRDALVGDGQDNTLKGGGGGDTLRGMGGIDRLYGGDGEDTLTGDLADATIDGGADRDFIFVEALPTGATRGLPSVSGGGGDDSIHLSFDPRTLQSELVVDGGDGDDVLVIDPALDPTGVLVVGTGHAPGAATETGLLRLQGVEAVSIVGPAVHFYGDDTGIVLHTGGLSDLLVGGAGDDALFADAERPTDPYDPLPYDDDRVYGGGGDDALYGGQGQDVLNGGDGDDYIHVQAGPTEAQQHSWSAWVYQWSDDTIDGGAGNDTAVLDFTLVTGRFDFTLAAPSQTTLVKMDDAVAARVTGVESLVFIAGSGDDVVVTRDGEDGLLGGGGTDWLISGGGDDYLDGGTGHDSLWGGAGDDVLAGEAGDDTLFGDVGRDTASYRWAAGAVEVDLTIIEEQQTRGDGVDTLISIENLVGSDYGDRLTGDAGANVLNGGLGADILTGGAGADTFVFEWIGDSGVYGPDLITDFARGDRIDLSAFDGNPWVDGRQALHLGATADHLGDVVLAYDAAANRTSISLHIYGDEAIDALITLTGDLTTLTASDFIL